VAQASEDNLNSTDAIINLQDAIALIDNYPALSGMNFRLEQGETVHIKGPNGAGKTTLLSLMAGLLPLHSGQGQVLDNDLSDLGDRRRIRRLTGLLSHESSLYDELTVFGNLKFWCSANKVEHEIIDPIMDRLGLSGRLRNLKVSSLSAGQRRRTSLAVIVCRRPRLWLLDEPYSGLDEAGQNLVDAFVQTAVTFGASVVFASHDSDRAKKLASRTVEMQGGRLKTQKLDSGSHKTRDYIPIESGEPLPDGTHSKGGNAND